MEPAREDTLLRKKYESLLSGLLPDLYKDHILSDKLTSLQHENSTLELTVLQLRHEISKLTEKQKFSQSDHKSEKISYKFHALSTELAKCLEVSGCELSKFSESYNEAIEALQTWGEGFTGVIFSMKSRLYSSNKQLLDFMHSILNELNTLRSKLTIVQNYLAVLEFNETTLRDSLRRLETRNTTSRSVSVSRMGEIEKAGPTESKRYYNRNLVLDIAPLHRGENRADEGLKANKLKLSLDKLKIQKERAEIETEMLLLQLKQTKELLAMAEETASAKELLYENRIKKLNQLIGKIKEIPKVEELVEKLEREIESGTKKRHTRTRSNNILYNG